MDRNIYDRSFYCAQIGMHGRVTTLATIPVTNNETLSINLVGALRCAELTREMVLDSRVDLFAFYVPHRHIWGSDWTDMVTEGMQTATTLSTTDITDPNPPGYLNAVPNTAGGTVPDMYPEGYIQIWNNYFRVPNNTAEIASGTVVRAANYGVNGRLYGLPAARLPMFWNTGIDSSLIDATDYQEVVPNGSGNIELIDISRIQAVYKDQIDREWFMHRYREVLEYGFGSNGVNIDADQRPELLGHLSTWLSGYNVLGTDSTTLGSAVGRSEGMVEFHIPPKNFKEGGLVWLMAVLRFPSIWREEKNYLACNTLTYDNFIGDPNVIKSKPPIELDMDDFTDNSVAQSMGVHPYAQWYRTTNNQISAAYDASGWPFIASTDITSAADMDILTYDEIQYTDFWSSTTYGTWNIFANVAVESRSVIPKASESLYAGAHLR